MYKRQDQIISSLGIGVVRFNGELEPPDVNDFDYEYRVDTDVISSVEVLSLIHIL